MKWILIFLLPLYSFACEFNTLGEYFDKTHNIPGADDSDFEISQHEAGISLAKYKESCGIQGCEHVVYSSDKKGCLKINYFIGGFVEISSELKNKKPRIKQTLFIGEKEKIQYFDFDPKSQKYKAKISK